MSAGKYEYVDPADLRFTQPSIRPFFRHPYEEDRLPLVVDKMKRGLINPSVFEPLDVHRDKDGIMRCENNQRLWVWRKAGVRSIKVKVKSNDFPPRRQNNEDIANMIDPNAFSNIRGVSGNDRCNLEDPNVIRPITTQATGSASKTGNSGAEETPNPERGENETPFADILASAFVSVVMGVGFKLFRVAFHI